MYFSGGFPLLPALPVRVSPLKKNFEKSFEKIWKLIKKVLTFAAAFPVKRKRQKKRSLMNLHKQ